MCICMKNFLCNCYYFIFGKDKSDYELFEEYIMNKNSVDITYDEYQF